MGINRWEEPKEINNRINRLMKGPRWDIDEAYYKSTVLDYFDSKCKESRTEFEEAKKVIPEGNQHRQIFSVPFPITFKGSMGAMIEDVDGNEYHNFNHGENGIVIGGCNVKVKEAVEEALEIYGTGHCLANTGEQELAKEIQLHMPHMELIRFFGSRTEATMAAVRLARAASGKKKIIKLSGGYHGWYDDVLLGNKIPGSKMMLDTFGLNRQALKFTKEVRANSLLDIRKALTGKFSGGGIAAIIIEPIGADDGRIPVDYYFCKKIRKICDEMGVLLIFDEAVTGFRLGTGGVSGYLGVTPDLTILGNVVAGGLSGGAVGGKREIMAHFGTEQPRGKHRAYVGSSLDGNPVSAKAGMAAIKEIVETDACEKAAHLGDMLADGINRIVHEKGVPIAVYNQGSIVHLEISGSLNFDVSSTFYFVSMQKLTSKKEEIMNRKAALDRINAAFMAEGILLCGGRKLYVTADMTEDYIKEALVKIERVINNLKPSNGTIPKESKGE